LSTITSRLAAAPISWGVCEVPGWGHQLGADKVLSEMTALGISATEFGPAGFLPEKPAERAAVLKHHQLQAIGGFFPILLHDPSKDPLAAVSAELDAYEAAGATVMVLDAEGWDLFGRNLDIIVKAAADKGIQAVVHPHVGTMIETTSDVNRVLNDTNANLCLDTGHLLIGGTDPGQLVRDYASRIGHTHLKDVKKAVASRVQAGEISYTDGVKTGMYVPLGQGDVGIDNIVKTLLEGGYTGWFTMEQDTILETAPAGEGPVSDVRQSVAFLRNLDAELTP
jgi:inosose dehydratase